MLRLSENTLAGPILTLVLAAILVVVGALFKIQHWPGASLLLVGGLAAEGLGFIWLLAVLLKPKKKATAA